MGRLVIGLQIKRIVGVRGHLGFHPSRQFRKGKQLTTHLQVALAIDDDLHHVRLFRRLRGDGRRQIHLQGAQPIHGQGDHHERGQEEKHHVNQRDDLNTGFLDGGGRSQVHKGVSVRGEY